MIEYRWSYDPRTGEFTAWNVESGRPNHWDKFGDDGYRFHAQGRIYVEDKKATLQFYTTRPAVHPDYPIAPPDCAMPNDVRLDGLDIARDWCRDRDWKVILTEGLV